MYQSNTQELLPIRSIEDSFDKNEDINHCMTMLIDFVDALNEGMTDLYRTIEQALHPQLEKFLDNSSKKTRKKSQVAWKELKKSFDKLFITIVTNLFEVTQRIPLISQLLKHFNYVRQEKSNLSPSQGDNHKKIQALNKQMKNISKLYNIETTQYNKVIKDFQNTVEYMENNKRFERNIPPGRIVILLQDVFAKVDNWLLSYENIPPKTLQEASNDIEERFQYATTTLKNFILFKLLELNDYTLKYIEY